MTVTTARLAVGLAGALICTSVLASRLYQTSVMDGGNYLLVAGLIVASPGEHRLAGLAGGPDGPAEPGHQIAHRQDPGWRSAARRARRPRRYVSYSDSTFSSALSEGAKK